MTVTLIKAKIKTGRPGDEGSRTKNGGVSLPTGPGLSFVHEVTGNDGRRLVLTFTTNEKVRDRVPSMMSLFLLRTLCFKTPTRGFD